MREKFTRQSSDERGVSPVIGVILMVAITVILAAVIGFFVLDLGSSQQSTPQASFEVQDDGSVVMTGGDSIDPANLKLDSSGVSVTGSEVTAGTKIGTESGTGTATVTWTGDNGQSATLASIDYDLS